MSSNLKMTRGDTKVVQFTVSQLPSAGLTGFSFWFTAKYQVSDADAAAVFEKTTADFTVTTVGNATTNGVCTCTIAPTDTSTLPDYDVVLLYDFQVKDTGGNITTAASGTLTVSPDVTRAG